MLRRVTVVCALAGLPLVGGRVAVADDALAADAASTERAERARAAGMKALAAHDFIGARKSFEEVLSILPGDAPAARDAARAAAAAGQFDYAEQVLETAHEFDEHRVDPELHYLRGEALYALNRGAEAKTEHRICELEIGQPKDRMQKLWLARVFARRGELSRADIIYDSLWPPAPAFDAEAAINQAEAHVLNRDWSGGQLVIERLLARDPKNLRARQLLAYVLELRGDLDHELPVRREVAFDDPSADSLRGWGRALERAEDFPGAYQRYEDARAMSHGQADETLTTSLLRMHYRITPEASGGLVARRDPQADSLRAQAGLALPFGARHSLSFLGWSEATSGRVLRGNVLVPGGGNTSGVSSALTLADRGGLSLSVGGELRAVSAASAGVQPGYTPGQLQAGANAEVVLPFLDHTETRLHGDFNRQWNDAPVTVSEGGKVDGAGGQLFAFPTGRRVLAVLGGEWRRFHLAPQSAGDDPTSTQSLFFGGADLVLWNNPVSLVRGEALDEKMLRRSYLSDAGILSYRHYQLFGSSSPEFASRIVLASRAAIHNGSMVVRKALAGERVGVEARGSLGYDTARNVSIYSLGASAMLVPFWSSRILASYDLAKESATGFTGTRQTGWVTYHVDF
jgi:tetratricopeptide (TPR) repeat protein